MKRNHQCKYTIDEEKKIISDYLAGGSMASVGKKWNIDPSTVMNILRAYNVPARTLSQARRNACSYQINETVFENIDTRDKAYWLGVMYTDGYICKANPYTHYFGLTVKSTDIEWLEKFQKFLEATTTIKTYKHTIGSFAPDNFYSRLLVGNNKIVSDLEKHGVVERKTFLIKSIPDILYKDDFVRGVVDGDGSLRKTHPEIRISGGEEFLKDIGEYLGYPYHITPDKTIFCLRFPGQAISKKLENRLYNGANYYLDRKYNLAKRSFISPFTSEDV